jgi:2'-5' RNA ligase
MRAAIRTFIAVEISPEVRARAGQLMARLGESGAKVKWVEPHNLHLTLKFLGDVDARDLPAVCGVVAEAVRDVPAFEIEFLGAGAFPAAVRPRTLWLGVGRGSEGLIEVHERLERQLAGLGFRREGRRFQPHLTIGRVRSEATGELGGRIAALGSFAGGVSCVDEVVVFSSELAREGPTYERMFQAPLEG